MAALQPGALTAQSEAGDEWQVACAASLQPGRAAERYYITERWFEVVAALQLKAGQTVCLAVLSPNRLLVSRQGEPHFSAAAAQGPPDPWPLTVILTEYPI